MPGLHEWNRIVKWIRRRTHLMVGSFLCRQFAFLQDLVNLLFAQEVPAVVHVRELGKLSEAYLFCHATYHVLFLRHLDVESLLLHLHGVVLDDLLIRVEESLQNLRLNVGKAESLRRLLAVIVTLFYLFELIIHVLFQLIPLSNQALHVVSDSFDPLQKYGLITRYVHQLFLEQVDLLKTFLMLG